MKQVHEEDIIDFQMCITRLILGSKSTDSPSASSSLMPPFIPTNAKQPLGDNRIVFSLKFVHSLRLLTAEAIALRMLADLMLGFAFNCCGCAPLSSCFQNLTLQKEKCSISFYL